MVAPGPDGEALQAILTAAMRVPDHGKLAPWRFVVVGEADRDAFAALLRRAYLADHAELGPRDAEAIDQFAHQAPTLIVVLSTPRADSSIPLWEQELSAGALCMNLLAAIHAAGFVGCWLTGWAAYSPVVVEGLSHPGARLAGFLFAGTPNQDASERPRPGYGTIVSHWSPIGA